MESVLSVPLFLFVDVCVPGLSCPQLTSCCGKPTVFSCRWQRWETVKRLTIQPLDLRFCFYNFFIPHLFLCLSSPQDFYQRERHAKFHLLPDTLDLWAESTQQRLLGYQEQAVKLVNVSRRGNGLPHEWPPLCLRVKLKVQILNISFFFTFLLPCSLFSRSGKPGGHFQGPASWLPFSVDQQLWTETRGRAHTDGVWNQTEPGGASGQQWAGEGENIKDSLDTRTRLSRSWSTRPTTDVFFSEGQCPTAESITQRRQAADCGEPRGGETETTSQHHLQLSFETTGELCVWQKTFTLFFPDYKDEKKCDLQE